MKKTLDDLTENTTSEPFQLDETTELGQVMQNLDGDTVDMQTRMSSIDFNTRLTPDQIKLSTMIDVLERMGVFPKDTGLTRQMKRLSVSLAGQGREEKVRIVQGERSQRSGNSFTERLGNLFRPMP